MLPPPPSLSFFSSFYFARGGLAYFWLGLARRFLEPPLVNNRRLFKRNRLKGRFTYRPIIEQQAWTKGRQTNTGKARKHVLSTRKCNDEPNIGSFSWHGWVEPTKFGLFSLGQINQKPLVHILQKQGSLLHNMAEDAVNAAVRSGKLSPSNGCVTENLCIVGGDGWEPASFTTLAQYYTRMKKTHGGKVIPGIMDSAISKHLSHAYGTSAERVAIIAQNENLGKRLAHGYPFLEAEVAYCARQEYCESAVDFIARRSRLAFLDTAAARRAIPRVIEILASEHKWDKARKKHELQKAKEFLETFKSSKNAQFNDGKHTIDAKLDPLEGIPRMPGLVNLNYKPCHVAFLQLLAARCGTQNTLQSHQKDPHQLQPGSLIVVKSSKFKFKYTQMAGKLILSLDRNLIMEETVHDGSIQFRVEFQNFKLSIDGETLIDLPAGLQWDLPLVEITLGSGVDSPISKMEIAVIPLPIVLLTEEDKHQESMTIDEGFSQSEIGSSSSTLFVTSKNRKKNYLRRLRKRNFKARMIDESETFKRVECEAKQEFVAPYTSPLPFSQRKEVVSKVAQSSMRLLDYYTKRINQDRIEPAPGIDPRPQVEGYDPSTLLDDIKSRFYTCPTMSSIEEEV
ncbi:hypothetical protein M5K25_022056 [Dendrobium thyrsiflorum]|uniref:glycerol-3-phosphate dehydrogenase n=1 Tax=Dendrobium thyrsiflorum TaxID=117978 RepID=A0ABD0U5I1_DENTH